MMILIIVLVLLLIGSLAQNIRTRNRLKLVMEQVDHFLYFEDKILDEKMTDHPIDILQNRIMKLELKLVESKLQLKEREEQLTEFMENLSHQMKTAVTAIQIRLDLAYEKVENPSAVHELDRCQECVERLTSEIERLLNASLLATHKTNMVFGDCQITGLVRSAIEHLQPLASGRKTEICLYCDEEISLKVDAFWVEQVMINLIKNAVEHSDTGSSVEVHVRRHNKGVAITVRDYGKGIDETDLPHIFERFYRVDDDHSGYGIGLSMSKDIVDLHHGTISVSNEDTKNMYVENRDKHHNKYNDGKGAVFTVYLPDMNGSSPY